MALYGLDMEGALVAGFFSSTPDMATEAGAGAAAGAAAGAGFLAAGAGAPPGGPPALTCSSLISTGVPSRLSAFPRTEHCENNGQLNTVIVNIP